MVAAVLGGLIPSVAVGVRTPTVVHATNNYAATVLADNPVSYWRLNEASGTTAADQENRNPGTILGGVTLGQAGPISGGGAMSFDGSSGYIDMGSGANLMPTGPMSVEGWFESTTVRTGIVAGSRPWGWNIQTSGTGGACGGIFDNVGSFHGTCTNNGDAYGADGVWHYLVASSDGTTIRTYVDGALVGAAAAAAPGYNQQNCGATIGANHIVGNCATDPPPIAGYFFKGSIAEVAVYNYALSSTQVVNHYLASGYTAPPIGGNPTVAETIGNEGNFCWICYARRSVHGSWAKPIDSATGNFSVGYTDLAVPGRGIPLLFTHSYNAMAASTAGPLGPGWTDDYAMSLSQNGTTATVTGPNGSQVTFTLSGTTYTAAPRVQATLVNNGDGTFTFTQDVRQIFTFNASGQLTQQKDLNGYVTSLAYNGSGQLTTVTDAASRTLTLAYTGSNLTSVTDPMGRVVHFAYNDGAGDLTDVTDVNGGVTHYTYDSNHLLLTVTDPRNHVVITNVYDTSSRVTSQTDGDNRTITFAYTGTPLTSAGGSTTITDPKGNVTVEQYVNGEKVSETRGSGTSQAATWQYRFDPATLGLDVVVDPNGHVSSTQYDTHGNLLIATDALGRSTSYGYDSLNDPTSSTDPLGITTSRTYDTSGNLLTVSTPLVGSSPAVNQVTTYTYGDTAHPGDVTAVTDPDGKVSHTTYDANGDVASTTDPTSDQTTMAYNSVGWLTSTVSPKGNATGGTPSQFTTTYSYTDPTTGVTDEFGDVRVITDPLGDATTTSYDADRNLVSVKDPDGNLTQYTYDAANQQTDVTRADATTLHTDYFADGSVQDQVNGANDTTSYTYDPLGHLSSTTDPLGNVTGYSSDALGNVLTKTDPGGSCTATPEVGCTSYVYDAASELSSITYSDGVTPNVTGLTYDADGQRTGMTDGTGRSSWTWDSLHRMTAYANGNGASVSFGYNLRGLETTVTYPGSLVVTNGYDDSGRMTSVKDWLNNTTTFGYDANSNLASETLPPTGSADTFTFDRADRLMSISDASAGGTPFAAVYTRDANGQVTADTSATTGQSSYKYTALNQVCYAGAANGTACSSPPARSQPFAYDSADNLTLIGSTDQAFNAASELCWTASATGTCASPPSGATTYTYDTRGNRTKVTPSHGSATTLTYDQANRLTGFGSGATYTYNGDGLRMSKTVSGTTTQELWNVSGSLPLLLKDGTTSYVYGPGGLPLEQVSGSTVLYYNHDGLGSTRLLTSASGSSAATYTFDPYGNLTASSGKVTNPFLYAGQYRDADSGLYYLRARYYDPATAQFLTRDPLVDLTHEPYAYSRDDPTNLTDPTGLSGGLCNDELNPGSCLGDVGSFFEGAAAAAGAAAGAIAGWFGGSSGTIQAQPIGPIPEPTAVPGPAPLPGLTTSIPIAGAVGFSLCDNVLFAKRTGKERASDTPSWFDKGTEPLPGETPSETARRVMEQQYPGEDYPTGPGSEFSKVKKWISRNF